MKTTCWQIRVLSVLSNIHKLEIGKQDDVEEQVSLLTLKAYFETCCDLRKYLNGKKLAIGEQFWLYQGVFSYIFFHFEV